MTEASRARLRAAGYEVKTIDPGTGEPSADSALEVALGHGARVSIYFYRTAADAAMAARPFRDVERTHPKQFALRRVGAVLYVGTVQEPKVLSLTDFRGIIAESSSK
jgi:hypothetical protein